MRTTLQSIIRAVGVMALPMLFATLTGCITYSHHAIPADRLPPELRGCSKSGRVPVNIALLGQQAPRVHTIGAGDLLSVYIRGVLPPETTAAPPMMPNSSSLQRDVYPPVGQLETPSMGVPIMVAADGTLPLPVLGNIPVAGLSIQQAADKIALATVEQKILEKGREYVYLNLVRSRVSRIVVVREEANVDSPTMMIKQQVVYAKRGHAHILDLPAYENDVLHALTSTGGMPALDACNEVWILRQEQVGVNTMQQVWDHANQGSDPTACMQCIQPSATAKRIPLWTYECEAPNFCADDVVLRDGDVLYLKSRDDEYFYTGGLLPGAAIPLPRDRDIDIVEAIAIANGSMGGPGGTSGVSVFRSGAGLGNIIPPTRAMVVRKLPGNQQIAIRVNLDEVVRKGKQRVIIQPGDFVMLNYKPGEVAENALLNVFNLNVILSPGD